MACITELATGYPGYNGVIPFENGMLSEMLLEHGYSTFMVGKWHLTPSNQETAAGPYDRWPLGRGFQRFYGFLGGDTSQWYPDLVYDNHQVEPPKKPEEGYHLSEDLVDKAVSFIADSQAGRPGEAFYLHLCFGATHAPHHVAKEWADKYKGVFDDGWDAYREKMFARQKELGIVPADAELSRHDPDVPDWDSQPAPARRAVRPDDGGVRGLPRAHRPSDRAAARFPRTRGELENTLIMVISDNGAVRRGRPDGNDERGAVLQQRPGADRGEPEADRRDRRPEALQPLPVGMDVGREHAVPPLEARDLPRRGLRPVHRLLAGGDQGEGRRAPAVRAHHRHGPDRPRPARARASRARSGASPSRRSMASASPTPSMTPSAETHHHTQYFEMLGHRAIYHDGWRAVCPWPGPSFTEAGKGFGEPISAETLSTLDATGWELYHVAEDFAETHDVAADNRDKLIAMIGTWYVEAGKYQVMPIDGSGLARMVAEKPLIALPRDSYTYLPNTQSVPNFAAPKVLNRPHSITADVEIPDGGRRRRAAEPGNRRRRYSFYVQDGKLRYVHNYVGRQLLDVESEDIVPGGQARAPLRVRADRPA